jgi:hypothetical protein
MGVLKIWHTSPEVVENHGMLQQVQALMAQDADPQVCVCVLCVCVCV